MKSRLLILFALYSVSLLARGDESVQTFRITGLFDQERMADLKQAVADLHDAELVSCDYETALAEIRLGDPWLKQREKDPDEFIKRFGHDLRLTCKGTFDAKLPSGFPKEKWKVEKIPVYGLDCRGCSFGAYLAVCDEVGVERAVSSFSEGFVTVWINPEKTNREALKQALLNKKMILEPIEDETKKE